MVNLLISHLCLQPNLILFVTQPQRRAYLCLQFHHTGFHFCDCWTFSRYAICIPIVLYIRTDGIYRFRYISDSHPCFFVHSRFLPFVRMSFPFPRLKRCTYAVVCETVQLFMIQVCHIGSSLLCHRGIRHRYTGITY